jgi:hypothetical protein
MVEKFRARGKGYARTAPVGLGGACWRRGSFQRFTDGQTKATFDTYSAMFLLLAKGWAP